MPLAFLHTSVSGLRAFPASCSVARCATTFLPRVYPAAASPFGPRPSTPSPTRILPHLSAAPPTPPTPPTPPSAPATPSPPRITWFQFVVVSVIGIFIGATGSTVGTLVGAGGGIVITPLLTLILALKQRRAHGTSLCVVAVTALVGAHRYHHAGLISLPYAAALSLSAVVFAPIGAFLAARRVDNARLRFYFGVCLLVVAAVLPIASPLMRARATATTVAAAPHAVAGLRRVMLGVVGVATGLLAGLLGIGGGIVMVPGLALLCALPQKMAQGTALAAMVGPAIVGALTHARLGNVSLVLLPGLLLGALKGGSWGSKLAIFLPDRALRLVCTAIFAAVGLKYVRQGRAVEKEDAEKAEA